MSDERRVIVGGLVMDGTGSAGQEMDVYVDGEHISDVAPPSLIHGRWTVIDAAGLVIAPGFIDVHSHADNAPLLKIADTTKICQGVTTEVVGNCGLSLAPVTPGRERAFVDWAERLFPEFRPTWHSVHEYFQLADSQGYVTNYVPLVGHGALRLGAVGMANRPPTEQEFHMMEAMLDEALAAGVWGFSSGLIYEPGVFSTSGELIRLARRLPAGGMYASHVRGESATVMESIAEAIAVGSDAQCRVQVSHHKITGPVNWGRSKDTLAQLRVARGRGVHVRQDVYPYTSTSTTLTALVPPTFHDGDDSDLLRKLAEPTDIARLRAIFTSGQSIQGWKNPLASCGWEGVVVAATASHRFEGESMESLARMYRLIDPVEAFAMVLREERLRVTSICLDEMSEDDLVRILCDPETMIGSDGLPPGRGGRAHPRITGTFPRVLGRYARERHSLGLGEAIRKMTSLPASHFGITERGQVRPGWVADLVAFDPAKIADMGGYAEPLVPPCGIAWVMLGGRVVVRDNVYQGSRSGCRMRPEWAPQLGSS